VHFHAGSGARSLPASIKGLPAGEYLAVALEYVEDGAWNDPEYLDSIRPYGQRVKLLDSGSRAIALELISPQ